jgi:hypothetical protein
MDRLHLNLPLLLWAISWNVPSLTANNRIRFARTALMVSDELPAILVEICDHATPGPKLSHQCDILGEGRMRHLHPPVYLAQVSDSI